MGDGCTQSSSFSKIKFYSGVSKSTVSLMISFVHETQSGEKLNTIYHAEVVIFVLSVGLAG